MSVIASAINRIRYKDWKLAYEVHHGHYLLYWLMTVPDYTQSGYEYPPTFDTATVWSSRKHHVPASASEEDIIGTAFMAVKLAEEHKTLEAFHIDGKAPFNPHRSVL